MGLRPKHGEVGLTDFGQEQIFLTGLLLSQKKILMTKMG